MIDRLGAVLPLAASAVFQPREAVRVVLDTPADRRALINAAFLVIVLGLMVEKFFELILVRPDAPDVPLVTSFMLQLISVFGLTAVFFFVGRIFGGRADWDMSLKAVVWFSFMMLLAQTIFLVLLALSPLVAGLAMLLLVVFAVVQMCAITMETQGFENVFGVIFGILGTAFVFGMAMLILLAALGITFPGAPPST